MTGPSLGGVPRAVNIDVPRVGGSYVRGNASASFEEVSGAAVKTGGSQAASSKIRAPPGWALERSRAWAQAWNRATLHLLSGHVGDIGRRRPRPNDDSR